MSKVPNIPRVLLGFEMTSLRIPIARIEPLRILTPINCWTDIYASKF
jgi:hypothetical protein